MSKGIKRCTKCQLVKPLDAFNRAVTKALGVNNLCKTCQEVYSRHYRATHHEKELKRHREYRRTHRQADRVRLLKWYRRNPLSHVAHQRVYMAVRHGKMTRPKQCACCDKPGKVQAHHKDYKRPLDVQWLCAKCHKRLHAG